MLSKIRSVLRSAESRCFYAWFVLARSDLTSGYELGDRYRRIYHYHVRKTGGTSINQSFLSLGGEPGDKVYRRLTESRQRLTQSGNRVFIGWNNVGIESGAFFFAFSHHPKYRLKLPPATFTITCLRDPVARVLSHYKMLLDYRRLGITKPNHLYEGEIDWAAGSFRDFLDRIPAIHLFNQIHMFSERLSPEEAAENAAACDAILRTENLVAGVKTLASQLRLDLDFLHVGRASEIVIDNDDVKRLRERLAPEYQFFKALEKARPDFARGVTSL